MSDFLQEIFAQRIGGRSYGTTTAIYKFEKIKRAKAEARQSRPEVPLIDMGVGEPDEMAFPSVVETLREAAGKPENRGYSDNGGMHFKEAAARYMKEVFGVSVDPKSEVVHSIGSKAALSILPACFIDPGDLVLMTAPGYPVFGTHARYYGGEVVNLALTAENGFLPDLKATDPALLDRAKVLVLNYPNNPTGASATREFFEEAVALARRHRFIILQDAAYAALVFEGEPLSILQVEGAKDVALELHSLSKSFNMTGWRIGWVCGNARLVQAYGDVKDNSDSGQFLAIQEAAAAALDDPAITRTIATKYSRRMDLLVRTLAACGFDAKKPKASFFLYVRAPNAVGQGADTLTFDSGEAFSQYLIKEHSISTVPWDEAGAYIRFSVTFQANGPEEEEAVMEQIRQRLAGLKLHFSDLPARV